MGDRNISLGIDASGATVGAEEYRRAMEIVRAHNRQAVEGVREVERSMHRSGEVGGKAGAALVAAFQRSGAAIVASGGSIRGVLGSLSSEMSNAASGSDGLAASLGLSSSALAALGVGVGFVTGVGAALGFAAKQALDLEQALRVVVARTDPSQLDRYRQAALGLAEATGATQAQASEALTASMVAGFATFEEQIEASRLALSLTRTEFVGAGEAIQAVDGVLDVFNLTADHTGEVVDKVVVAARLGEKPFRDFATATETAGARLSEYGFGLDDVLAALTLVTPKSANAAQAGNSLAELFKRLTSTTDPLQEKLKDLGYTINADTLAMDGAVGTLRRLREITEGQPTLKADLFPDARSSKGILAALSSVEEKGKAAQDAIAGAAGAQAKSFANIAQLPSEELDRAQEGWTGYWTMVGTGFTNLYSEIKKLDLSDFVPTGLDLDLAMQAGREGDLVEAASNKAMSKLVGSWQRAFHEIEIKAKATSEVIKREVGGDWDAAFDLPEPKAPKPVDLSGFLPVKPTTGLVGPEASAALKDFIRDHERARTEAESLAATLRERLAGALEDEVAGLRGSEAQAKRTAAALASLTLSHHTEEDAIRKKIQAYQDLNGSEFDGPSNQIQIDELRAQLFALVQANDATRGSMERSAHSALLAADSHRLAELAAFRYSKAQQALHGTTESIGDAHWAAIIGVKALTKALLDRLVAQQKSFAQGPQRMVEDYEFQASMIGKTADEQERLTALRQYDAQIASESFDMIGGAADAARERLKAALDDSEVRRRADAIGHAIADPIGQGAEQAILSASNAAEAIEGVWRQMLANLLRMKAIEPFTNWFSGILGGAFGGGGGGVGGDSAAMSSQGNVFGPDGDIQPFSRGGIPDLIDQPTLSPIRPTIARFAFGGLPGLTDLPDYGSSPAMFSMGGGRTGSIREGGKPEVIMPVIARGPNGRMGVELVGKAPSSGASTVNHNSYQVIQNISTPNPAAFRASQRQNLEDARMAFGRK